MPSYRSSRGPMPGQATMDAFLAHARSLPAERVLNVRDYPGGIPDDAVYIGRGGRYGARWYPPSKWRNPTKIAPGVTRAEAIAAFERHARGRLADDPEWLAPLRHKRLACHCAPLDCHAAVLLVLLKERYGDD